ncbi:MAG: ATP-binding protein, partial [Clostridia bacterium]|nr:ATP-binding protein [Clostridia bacterium]
MIFGRTKETERLRNAYKSEYSSFVAVYGRRRIGKTFLIRETFDYKFAFQHAGISKGTKEEQIKEFCKSILKAGYKEISEKDFVYPDNWLEAFYLLEKFLLTLPKGKKIVFIDELSWMDTQKSGLVTALENFWNGWASARKDIMLIVCASATSWMLDNIIHNKGGLYNRLTERIHLDQFTLKECKEFIKSNNISMNDYQIL